MIGHFDNLINLTIPAAACLAQMFPNNLKTSTYLSHLALILMTPYEKKANKPFQTARLSNTSVHPEPSYSLKATWPFISPSLKTSRPENSWTAMPRVCMAHPKSCRIFNLTYKKSWHNNKKWVKLGKDYIVGNPAYHDGPDHGRKKSPITCIYICIIYTISS